MGPTKRLLILGLSLTCGLATLAQAAEPSPDLAEKRLDPRLKLLYRAQRGASSVAPERAISARLGSRAMRKRFASSDVQGETEPLLQVLVRYMGEMKAIEGTGFRVQSKIGNIVTGLIAQDKLSDLAQLPGVVFVQMSHELLAPPIQKDPKSRKGGTLPDVRAFTEALTSSQGPSRAGMGTGVLVASIDTGVDVFHQDFRNADGTTRIRALLDLSLPGDVDGDGDLDGPGPFGGTLFTQAEIDAALVAGTFPSKDTTGHGTHGLSIAAGDDPVTPGLAPGAELLVVKATRKDASLSFESADIVNAISFVDQKAAKLGRPYVANLSLGTIMSSHDGRSLEEQAIDALVGPGMRGKAVVVAAGNSSENGTTRYHHFQGTSYAGLTSTHTLTVPVFTPTAGRGNDRIVLDVWHRGRDQNRITVTGPGCDPVVAAYGDYADLSTPCGDVFVANMGGANPLNGDTEVIVLIDDWSGTAPAAGDWTLAIEGVQVDDTGVYHGWLSDDSQVGTVKPYLSGTADNLYLVGKPGGAYNAITVGSYARHDVSGRYRTSWTDVNGTARVDTSAILGTISDSSSPGKTRDGRIKPEVVAPGERVLGAVSQDAYPGVAPESIYRFHPFPEAEALIVDRTAGHTFGYLQGTSFAAPVVTGLVARLLEASATLDATQLRNILINSAVTDAFTGAVPNDLYGYGKVDESVGGLPLPEDLRITVDSAPNGVRNQQYNLVFTASGGTLPYSWSVVSGVLPPGLTFEASGFLTGKPTTAGSYTFTIGVTDASTPVQTDSRAYSIAIASNRPLRVSTNSLPVGRIDKPYEERLAAEGGTPPYTWSLAGGSLPPGLTLNADGAVTGTPSTLGRYDFTVEVTDATTAVAYRAMKIKVQGQKGDEWSALGKTGQANDINAIAIDPNDPNRVYVSSPSLDAIFMSTNGGDSWQPITINNDRPGASVGMLVHAGTSVLWASDAPWLFTPETGRWTMPSSPGGVVHHLETDDRGGIYVDVGRYVPPDGDPSFTPYCVALASSHDHGASWLRTSLDVCRTAMNNYYYGVAPSVHRADPEWIYANANGRLNRTSDGGTTWYDVTNNAHPSLVRVSQVDPLEVLNVSGGSVERTVDGGRHWTVHPVGGTATCLRGLETSDSLLLAGTTSGLFRSDDGGVTWQSVPIGGRNPGISAIAIDSANDARWFVGTAAGLLRTADGGQTWTLVNDGLSRRPTLASVLVSAAAPAHMMLRASDGWYLSRSGGDAWTRGTTLPLGSLVLSSADGNRFYAVNGGRLWRSDNAGVTWFDPNPSWEASFSVASYDADPADEWKVMVSLAGSRGTYRSEDGGATWADVSAGLPFGSPVKLAYAHDVPNRVYLSLTPDGTYRSDDGGDHWTFFRDHAGTFLPAPSNSEYWYAPNGNGGFFDPAVNAWQAPTTAPPSSLNNTAVDWHNHLVAYGGVTHPGTSADVGGLYRTTDGGRNWYRLPGVLDRYSVVSVATHPTASSILYVATTEGGAYRSEDGGVSWKLLDNYGTVADLANVNVQDPSNPNLLFAGTEGYGVQASANKGLTYAPRVTGLTNYNVNALAFDPDAPSTMYAATDGGLFVSTDSANTWAPTPISSGEITDVVTDNEGTIKRIWVLVRGQGVAYSADGGATFSIYRTGLDSLDLTGVELENRGAIKRIWILMHGGSGVAFSDDLGQTWTSAAGNGLTNRNVNDLAVENGTIKRIWILTDDGAFVSSDDGLSWSEMSLGLPGGIPATSIAIDPHTNEALVSLYSQSEGGVYRGGNVNGIWSAFNAGLDELRVRKLTSDRGHVIDALTNGTTFFAATSGDGVYATEILTSLGAAPTITTNALPNGAVRSSYAANLSATGGAAPYSWSLQAGSLPPGLVLEGASGIISGEPTAEGVYSFTIQVADRQNLTSRRILSMQVLAADTARVSISDVTVPEGHSGTGLATFTVSLSAAQASAVTVSYATADGTALAAEDYTATSGSVTIPAGSLSTTLPVTVTGDTTPEADETFFVNLSLAAGAVLGDSQGMGTITNDEAFPSPSFLISDVHVTEGNTGATAVFTVTLTPAPPTEATVAYATTDGTAVAGFDYTTTSGVLTFPVGTTTRTIEVPVLGDLTDEVDETFQVTLSGATGAGIVDGLGIGTIEDDDAPPTISAGNCTAVEGGAGTATCAFSITLSAASGRTVAISYGTADSTANAGTDYTAATGTLTFTPGTSSLPVNVAVLGDTLDEANEVFALNLFTPVNATLADAQGLGTIQDDDPLPTLSTNDAVVTEGNTEVTATVEVTLSAASEKTVTVQYHTVDQTATSPADYTGAGGSLTFAPGVTLVSLGIAIAGDTLAESTETFGVTLSNAVNASLGDAQGVVTIVDDEAPAPILTIGDASASEGAGTLTFPVTMSMVSGTDVTVSYATEDVSARAGTDYVATSGILTLLAGATTGNITVPVSADTLDEADETLRLRLSSPVGAVLGDALALGTIVDDDPTPALSVNDVSQMEGDAGVTAFTFTVTLSAVSGRAVTVGYATADGTATSGLDYTAATGTLTFVPGTTTQGVTVSVFTDTQLEGDETFLLTLASPVNATILDSQGIGTIVDDDPLPSLSVGDVAVPEGDAGTSPATVTVTLSEAASSTVTVAYGAANGTATSPADYTSVSGTLTFAPGITTRTFEVQIVGDTLDEPNETVIVALSNPAAATIADGQGVITITDDDLAPPPTVSIAGLTVIEGNSGTTNAVFAVSLSSVAASLVSVSYATSDGTAQAGVDYTAASGTVAFSVGTTTQTITVPVIGDTLPEAHETFTVTLSGPVGATLGTAVAAGTIQDDDPIPTLSVTDASLDEGDSGATAMEFTVSLSAVSGRAVTVGYATGSGTATPGSDYTATSGTLTFAPGTTQRAVSVTITGDTDVEAHETFVLGLSGAAGATIADGQGIGTILNDDEGGGGGGELPALSIGDVRLVEGNSGTTNAVFAVVLSASSAQTVRVSYATAIGTAVAGTDYQARTGTLTFPAGVIVQTISVPVVGETVPEGDEVFFVDLSTPTNATIADGRGVGTIVNDDRGTTQVRFAAASFWVNERGRTATITVRRTGSLAGTVSVAYQTADGTARAGLDYRRSAGILVFRPRVSSLKFPVSITNDTLAEGNETVLLSLQNPRGGATIDAPGTAVLTIRDDDGGGGGRPQ